MCSGWPFCFICYPARSRKTYNWPLPRSWSKRYFQAVFNFFGCREHYKSADIRVVPRRAGRKTDNPDVQTTWRRTCISRRRDVQFLFKSCRSVWLFFLGLHVDWNLDYFFFYKKPIDPIFYLHHANLDRIWWNWQQVNPSRLYEVSGRSAITPLYQNITLDFGLDMGGFAPTEPIREVMDIYSEPMCYTYV